MNSTLDDHVRVPCGVPDCPNHAVARRPLVTLTEGGADLDLECGSDPDRSVPLCLHHYRRLALRDA